MEKKYYRYQIDTIMGGQDNLHYKIRFIPKTKSDQLVGGYMIVSSDVWSVREIRFSGRSELLTFENLIKMGEVGDDNEFLPVRYEFEVRFNFVGNVVDGSYLASLDYSSIELKEKSKYRKEKKKLNLTESYTLRCDTNSIAFGKCLFCILTSDRAYGRREEIIRRLCIQKRYYCAETSFQTSCVLGRNR